MVYALSANTLLALPSNGFQMDPHRLKKRRFDRRSIVPTSGVLHSHTAHFGHGVLRRLSITSLSPQIEYLYIFAI